MVATPVLDRLCAEFDDPPARLAGLASLLIDEGATVPFVARYRKERSGGMDEQRIREIRDRLVVLCELEERKNVIRNAAREVGKLTDDLESKLSACFDRTRLEDLHLPFRPRRRTKAAIAIEQGLGPLAESVRKRSLGEKKLAELAAEHVSEEKGLATPEQALEGVAEILSEEMSEDADLRHRLRTELARGLIRAKVVNPDRKGAARFSDYFDFREPVRKIPAHRMLAIRRAEREEILQVNLEIPDDQALALLKERFAPDLADPETELAQFLTRVMAEAWQKHLLPVCEADVRRDMKERADRESIRIFGENLRSMLLAPPMPGVAVLGVDPGPRRGMRLAAVAASGAFLEGAHVQPDKAESLEEAKTKALGLIKTHGIGAIAIGNGPGSREADAFLRALVSAEGAEKVPAARSVGAEGAEKVPAARSVGAEGAEKVPAARSAGAEGAEKVPAARSAGAEGAEKDAAARSVGAEGAEKDAAARSAGAEGAEKDPAARSAGAEGAEKDPAARSAGAEGAEKDPAARSAGLDPAPKIVIVDEAGAAIYASSPQARKEFGNLDMGTRAAISIARRLQDPLAELVKLDPRLLGVGQYQHDVHQGMLARGLEAVIESAVNHVGADVNSVSTEMLSHISGLNRDLARAIAERRQGNGGFRSRQDLAACPGIGARELQQSGGFLRVKGGEEPLEATGIHPEHFEVVRGMALQLGLEVKDLLGNKEALDRLDRAKLITADLGPLTLADIVHELEKPGRDPRTTFKTAAFREDVKDLKDLKPGMELEGRVTNVTEFGAFVDLGIHQDGLIHVSQISDKFVKVVTDVVKVGDVVKVRVIEIDPVRRRISLTMRPPTRDAEGSGRERDRRPTTIGEIMERNERRGGGGRDRGRERRPPPPGSVWPPVEAPAGAPAEGDAAAAAPAAARDSGPRPFGRRDSRDRGPLQPKPAAQTRAARPPDSRRGTTRRPPKAPDGNRGESIFADMRGGGGGGDRRGGRDRDRGRGGEGPPRIHTIEPEKPMQESRGHKGELKSLSSLRSLFGLAGAEPAKTEGGEQHAEQAPAVREGAASALNPAAAESPAKAEASPAHESTPPSPAPSSPPSPASPSPSAP